MPITKTIYGTTKQGKEVYEYTLTNLNGTIVKIIEYGCTVTQIVLKGKDEHLYDVILGYNTLEEYESGTVSHGAFIGRHANRIENSEFSVEGKTYQLEPNNGKNHLHGTFSSKIFMSEIVEDKLVLKAVSEHMEEGFPGELQVCVTYSLTNEDALVMDYVATTNKPTIINLTNHAYFNLSGHSSENILGTELFIDADTFTKINEETCPTGEIISVKGTPFDFTSMKPIGKDMLLTNEQIKLANGYDHNFILNKEVGELTKAAFAQNSNSGISMTVYTTQPAVQLYTGNYLQDDAQIGKHGNLYKQYEGFCLETQHFPCTPSHTHFPSITLMPEEEYHHTTIYSFENI